MTLRDGRRDPSHDVQRSLERLTSAAVDTEAVRTALPGFDYDFSGGELVADVETGTIAVELTRVVREEREQHVSVDLTSAASVFARPQDEACQDSDPEATSSGESEWDIEWHAADLPTDWDALGDDLAEVKLLVEGIQEALGVGDDTNGHEDEDEDDPAVVMAVLHEGLALLRAAGVGRAVVRYSARGAMQELADAMTAAGADVPDESRIWTPAEVAAFTSDVAEKLLDESNWQLEDIELDGRNVVSEEPGVAPFRTVAGTVLEARFGDWNELGPTSAFGISGVLEIDVAGATAEVTHRFPSWHRLEPVRVELRIGENA